MAIVELDDDNRPGNDDKHQRQRISHSIVMTRYNIVYLNLMTRSNTRDSIS